MKYARILGDMNLQQLKASKKMTCVEKVKISKVLRKAKQRVSGYNGVISEIPLTVSMKELEENLRVWNKNANRLATKQRCVR